MKLKQMDYFISSYFNICGYESRRRLSVEFSIRYSNVIMLVSNYEDSLLFKNVICYETNRLGFITNILVNKFIESHDDIRSLTFIDSDVLLLDAFFHKVMDKIDEEFACFLQPFSSLKFVDGVKKTLSQEFYGSICANDVRGHTGLVYVYNREFIKLIEKFPTCLLLGSFDYFLNLVLLKRNLSRYLDFFNETDRRELEDFASKLTYCAADYIDQKIYSFQHGKFEDRRYNSRMSLYKNINNEVILNYFIGRKEDN